MAGEKGNTLYQRILEGESEGRREAMHKLQNDIFTKEDITDEFMNKIVFCEHFFNFGFICIPAPPQLTLYLEDGTEYYIPLDKSVGENYLSPQDFKVLLPDIYERFFTRKVFEDDENGCRWYKNWFIAKHYMPCMIRKDFYQEILESDEKFFDKYVESLPLAIDRYLCRKHGVDKLMCKEYRKKKT